MKRTEAGLAMTEALVTLAVVGVLLMVGLPSLRDFLENGQLSSDTNDLLASLLMTRSEAVTLSAGDLVQDRPRHPHQLRQHGKLAVRLDCF